MYDLIIYMNCLYKLLDFSMVQTLLDSSLYQIFSGKQGGTPESIW